MKSIESINNPFVKDLLKLHNKKYRDESRKFLIEGYHLIEEAKKSNVLEKVLITDEKDFIQGIENILVNKQIIEKLAFTQSPQNIIGLCHFFEEKEIKGERFLILDDLQDPGNIGTLVRSSLGFDIDYVILSSSSVDIYNDKFIRSTQGAIFNINIIKKDLVEVINYLKQIKIKVIGTSLHFGISLQELPKLNNYALILGNEGKGVRPEILDLTDNNIFIETNPKLESLNVAVAGSIIMYYLKK